MAFKDWWKRLDPVSYYTVDAIKRGLKGDAKGALKSTFVDPVTGAVSDISSGGGMFGNNSSGNVQPNFGVTAVPPEVFRRLGAARRSGAGQQDMAVGMLGASALEGADYTRRGRIVGDTGFGNAVTALDLQQQAAMGRAPSQAELLLQANADEAQRVAMAQAASARGGNQAAALRSATALGTQAQLQAGQQAAALRAEEMAAARQAYAQTSQGILGQGLGAEGQGIGIQADVAGRIGQLGAQREGLYTGAQMGLNQQILANMTELEKARLGVGVAQESGRQAMIGNVLGTVGTVAGGVAGAYFGGPVGAAAGASVGGAAGRTVGSTVGSATNKNAAPSATAAGQPARIQKGGGAPPPAQPQGWGQAGRVLGQRFAASQQAAQQAVAANPRSDFEQAMDIGLGRGDMGEEMLRRSGSSPYDDELASIGGVRQTNPIQHIRG